MRFWDASAVIPLLLEQPMSARARALLEEDPDVVIGWGTPVECASAFARLRRENALSSGDEAELARDLDRLRAGWFEMTPGDPVRAQAIRALRFHPLRSADALQLAAALEWSGTPVSGELVTFDAHLASAAEREGFSVLGAE